MAPWEYCEIRQPLDKAGNYHGRPQVRTEVCPDAAPPLEDEDLESFAMRLTSDGWELVGAASIFASGAPRRGLPPEEVALTFRRRIPAE